MALGGSSPSANSVRSNAKPFSSSCVCACVSARVLRCVLRARSHVFARSRSRSCRACAHVGVHVSACASRICLVSHKEARATTYSIRTRRIPPRRAPPPRHRRPPPRSPRPPHEVCPDNHGIGNRMQKHERASSNVRKRTNAQHEHAHSARTRRHTGCHLQTCRANSSAEVKWRRPPRRGPPLPRPAHVIKHSAVSALPTRRIPCTQAYALCKREVLQNQR